MIPLSFYGCSMTGKSANAVSQEATELSQSVDTIVRETDVFKVAKMYADTMAISKASIYNQLVSSVNKFSEEEARKAFESLEADWKSFALDTARRYVKSMGDSGISKKSIYDQLTSEFDGFTDEEAQYAIENLDFDWKESAVKAAKRYVDVLGVSKNHVYDKLVYDEKFTESEARHAVESL